jgi:DNA-binding MarR family transcriptional regulator
MHVPDWPGHVHGARAVLHKITGDDTLDASGLELMRMVRVVANLYGMVADEHLRPAEVSGPRWRLLLRLAGEEAHGHPDGVQPSHLARCQNVSKNTISALLRGLEEQGLVERTLNPDDRRVFRMRLSQKGRELLRYTTPIHVHFMNDIAAALSAEEQAQVGALLGKLYGALAPHVKRERDATEMAPEDETEE